MAQYRVLEIRDKLINNGEPYYVVQKRKLALFTHYWTEYFEEHSEYGATYYDRDKAMIWWEYHCDKASRIQTTVIAQRDTNNKRGN